MNYLFLFAMFFFLPSAPCLFVENRLTDRPIRKILVDQLTVGEITRLHQSPDASTFHSFEMMSFFTLNVFKMQ